jgi:hypothetical protein
MAGMTNPMMGGMMGTFGLSQGEGPVTDIVSLRRERGHIKHSRCYIAHGQHDGYVGCEIYGWT